MVVPIYRGLLAKGDWATMIGQGPLICDKLGITGNATIAEFVVTAQFVRLAEDILCDKGHPAVQSLSDHLMLECAAVIDMKPYGKMNGENVHAAQWACKIVQYHPIQLIED